MDPPVALGVETKPGKTDETNGSPKSYDCGLCDTEAVYKIAQELLPGLASSCVDNTTGGIFKNAASVAVDMRKEMVDYLTQRSESYVSEVLLTENSSNEGICAHPYDIILSLIDDFSASKRNMFSRVSEWVLSDRREDRIDDFVQEMEINGFWLLARRECVSSMLLKNVDYKNAFHCNMVCSSEHEVVDHREECKFRPMDCTNEGCTTRYCAAQKENHEAICPFMVLPCEQKCSDFVMRREMDRHCVTVCPMKLVNCAFYTVGCESSIPRCNLQQHNVDGLLDHLLYILRTAHKEAKEEDLKCRAEQIRNLSNTEKLARARDARALTYLIKDAEKKLGTLGESIEEKSIKDDNDSQKKERSDEMVSLTEKPTIIKEDNTESPTKEEVHQESPKSVETKEKVESPSSRSIESGVLADEEEQKELAKKEPSDSEEDESKKSPKRETVDVEKELGKSPKKEESKELSSSDEEESKKSPKKEETKESSRSDNEEELKKLPKKEVKGESSRSDEQEEPKKSPKKEESSRSDEKESKKSTKKEERRESSRSDEEEESKQSPKKEEIKESSRSNEEESKKSPKKEERKESSSSDEEGLKKSPKKEPVEEETVKPPKMEKTKELSDSDEEESTRSKKSPKKEERKESASSDEKGLKKSPKKEPGEEETVKPPKMEKTKELSDSDEEESTRSKKSPKKEERKESASSDEKGLKKSPKKEPVEEETVKPPKMEKTKELSDSDEEESTRSPLHMES